MKIIYVGNENPYFLNSNMCRFEAFKKLGHEVIFFDDRRFVLPGRLRRILPWLEKLEKVQIEKKLFNLAQRFGGSICFFSGGTMSSEVLKKLKSLGYANVLYTTDPPVGYFDLIVKTVKDYDFVFCAGTEAMEILERGGFHDSIWMPFCCEPQYHHPQTLTQEEKDRLSRDIVFIGSYYPNREKAFESLADLNIGIWGPGWENLRENSPLRKKVDSRRVGYQEWTKIISAAKIVLVAHYQDNTTPCFQVSPKLFESLACQAFVLVDSQRDAQVLFQDKKHVVFFKDIQDLKEKINYYLQHPSERLEIAQAGYKEVLNYHTYVTRVSKMMQIIEQKNFHGK